MVNVLIVAVIVLLLGGAGVFVFREKKKGKRCIGCPNGGSCGKCDCGK